MTKHGGTEMVKEAYSSGTPTIGVGPGNAPAWICSDSDLEGAATMIVESKSFDNGIICGSENHLVVDSVVHDRFVGALRARPRLRRDLLGHDSIEQRRIGLAIGERLVRAPL